jgi:DNA-binding Lrp family transcriptional regulator
MREKSHHQTLRGRDAVARDVKSLSALVGLSPVVQEIMTEWIAIRKFFAARTEKKMLLSYFKAVSEEERIFLTRLLERFEIQFKDDPELMDTTAPSTTEDIIYERAILRSIRLWGKSRGFSFLFPWQLFVEVRHNDDTPLLKAIIHNLTRFPRFRNLPAFIDLLSSSLGESRVKYSPLAVQYVTLLTDLHFGTAKHQFPTQQDLAGALGCTQEALSKIERGFTYLSVIEPRYLVNMGKLGFQAMRILHATPLPRNFQPFTLRTYPMDRETSLSVLYLPLGSILKKQLPEGKISPLHHYRISRTFEQLHPKPDQSWLHPVRLRGEYAEIVPPPRRGIWFDLTPDPGSAHRSMVDFRILDQIQLITSGTYAALADIVGMSEKHLRRRVDALLADDVIAPFYFIARIGLTANLLMTFEGDEADPEVEAFINNLLAFPYAEVFSGSAGGNAILKVPATWTNKVLLDILELRRAGLDVWGVISSPLLSRWGIPLAALALEDEFFGIQWKEETTEKVKAANVKLS